MSEKLQKNVRKLVKEETKLNLNDLIEFVCRLGIRARWYFAIRLIWGIKFEVTDKQIDKAEDKFYETVGKIKNAEK